MGADVKRWNPRYVAYARAHGRTPEEMRAHDEKAWPGGRACGFILWMSEQWARWRRERSRGTYELTSNEDQADFDVMIGAQRERA